MDGSPPQRVIWSLARSRALGGGTAAGSRSQLHVSSARCPDNKKSRSDFSKRLFSLNTPRQRPTLPWSCPHSTIGGIRLNFRVRNGNGCGPDPMTTGNSSPGLSSVAAASTTRQNFCKDQKKSSDQEICRSLTTQYSANGRFSDPHCTQDPCISLSQLRASSVEH
jgi:hypothetical protein